MKFEEYIREKTCSQMQYHIAMKKPLRTPLQAYYNMAKLQIDTACVGSDHTRVSLLVLGHMQNYTHVKSQMPIFS